MSAITTSISKCVTDVRTIIGSDTSRSLNKEDKDKIEQHLNDFMIDLFANLRLDKSYFQYSDETRTSDYVQDLKEKMLETIDLYPTEIYSSLDFFQMMILRIINDSLFLKEGVSKFCREDYMNLSKLVVLPLNQEDFVLVSQEDYNNYAPLIYEYEQNMINEDEEEDIIPSIYETQTKANWQYPDPPKLLRSYQRRIHSIYYKFDGKFLRAKYNSTICASVPCSWIPVRLDDGTIIWYNELV